MILDTIAASTRKRVDRRKEAAPEKEMMKLAYRELEHSPSRGRLPFREALRKPGISFICEVKKASPSKVL